MRFLVVFSLAVLIGTAPSWAQQQQQQQQRRRAEYPPKLPGAQVEVYKTIGDVELAIELIVPDGHTDADRRPAIVFFFGGGWTGGTVEQFRPQAEHLAERGMVAALADYRVRSRHKTSPFAWNGSPSVPLGGDLLWWLIVADDGAGKEGSFGLDSAGNERNASGLNGTSNRCFNSDKDVSNTCPP